MARDTTKIPFTSYQKLVIFLLAITQFTVILDFMVMSPMGDMLMKSLDMKPKQFGIAVSAYAFSAGFSGLLTAGFADKYDRKKLLTFFYTGFILGTLFCGFATSFPMLVAARILTGLFGGVIGSISMAIVTDLFDLHHRGRVMGFVQMGLGLSQVMGIPISLFMANSLGWQSPFIMVAILAVIVLVIIFVKFQPVTTHLALQQERSAASHLWHTVAKRNYRIGFLTTALLSVGGFMMMPFGAAYAINNLHLSAGQLPIMFMVSGIGTFIVMPLVGKLSDRVDKFTIFTIASLWMAVVVIVYTHLSATPLWLVICFNLSMMIGIMGRFIPAGALTTSIPVMQDRGAFMSINASLQQVAGGIAAAFAGRIVTQSAKGAPLQHYDLLGYIVVAIGLVCIVMLYRVSQVIKQAAPEVEALDPAKQENQFI